MGLDKSDRTRTKHSAAHWAIPSAMLALALSFMAFGDLGREWLRFDRVWIAEGETWRLITGHFAHLGRSHFVLNAAALLLVWFLVGSRYASRDWFIIIATSIVFMDIGFWVLNPSLYWYVGLSGLLHGVLVAGITARWRDMDGEGWLLAGLIVVKLAWEQFSGPLPGSEATSGGAVIVDAHLYGAVGGFFGAMLTRIRVRQKASI